MVLASWVGMDGGMPIGRSMAAFESETLDAWDQTAMTAPTTARQPTRAPTRSGPIRRRLEFGAFDR